MSTLNKWDEGSVRVVELNRPEKRNALNAELIADLSTALSEADQSTSVRALVIRGAGSDFCSGADLSELQKISEYSYEENVADARSEEHTSELQSRQYLV